MTQTELCQLIVFSVKSKKEKSNCHSSQNTCWPQGLRCLCAKKWKRNLVLTVLMNALP